MLTIESLIERGYLPYELVPAISTEKLAKILPKVIHNISQIKTENNSRYCEYTIPKVKHVRRLLAIPNPLHQIRLCQLIVNHWKEIDEYLDKSPISLGRPEISYLPIFGVINNERTFSRKINLSEIPLHRARLSTNSRYLLKVDISRFYPTIYTHIIPWALHTKNVAKGNVLAKKKLDLYGEKIDNLLRYTQANQTMGIPIGPDTSLIISEIVATAIDLELASRLKVRKIKLNGFRFVDDFYLYFNNISDAQYTLSELHIIMKEFELELNSEKTKIIELPDILEHKWVLELRYVQYQVIEKNELTNDELITYFSKAFELSKQFPDESVLKYALTEIMDSNVDKVYWKLYESLLLKAILSEPSVLPITTEIFLGYENAGYLLDKKKISGTMFELISYHAQFNHTHEITWALWMCKTLKIKIDIKTAKKISIVEDSIVALVALDLLNSGQIKSLNINIWKSLLKKEQLYSKHWLLAYEAVKKGWLMPEDGVDYLDNDPFFKQLKDNGVEFYDTNRQVSPAIIQNSIGDYALLRKKISRKKKKRFY